MGAVPWRKPRITLLIAWVLGACASGAGADVPLPPPPERYFNDHAGFVPADVASRLDETLRRFDEETTSQVVVAIFPRLPAPSLEDFTARTAQAWRVGRKNLDNGAVLFVFAEDRKLRLEVGYGLEERIPDATAKRIIEDVIVPRFRTGDAAGGLTAGVEAILAAARGEAPLEGARPASGARRDPAGESVPIFVVGIVITILMMAASMLGSARSATYSRRGRQQARRLSGGGCLTLLGVLAGLGGYLWVSGLGAGAGGIVVILAVLVVVALLLWAASRGGWSGGSGWSGGGWSSGGWGGSSGGGGGGFSGGGGSFGGGGASGSW